MKAKTQDTPPIYIGELNGTPLGDFRLAASDFGLVAVEWADSQPEFDSYLARLKRPVVPDAKRIKPYVKELAEYIEGKPSRLHHPGGLDPLHPVPARSPASRVPHPLR